MLLLHSNVEKGDANNHDETRADPIPRRESKEALRHEGRKCPPRSAPVIKLAPPRGEVVADNFPCIIITRGEEFE